MIDFGNGQPSLSLLPMAALRIATEDFLARGDASLLQYGENQGVPAFRASLAAFLTRRYAWPVPAEQLMPEADKLLHKLGNGPTLAHGFIRQLARAANLQILPRNFKAIGMLVNHLESRFGGVAQGIGVEQNT